MRTWPIKANFQKIRQIFNNLTSYNLNGLLSMFLLPQHTIKFNDWLIKGSTDWSPFKLRLIAGDATAVTVSLTLTSAAAEHIKRQLKTKLHILTNFSN